MHPNPIYRKTDTAQNIAFARERGFGVLAVSTDVAPHLSHVPFLLNEEGDAAELHLVRSNPICRAVGAACPARLDVLGSDAYISPDWYGIEDQVPTWNYVAVGLIGTLTPMPVEALDDLLARQSAFYEARLAPKRPWTMDKMTDETRNRFLRMILPFKLKIDDIQSTWKLSQNKPEDARLGAADAVEGSIGSGLSALADLMRDPSA